MDLNLNQTAAAHGGYADTAGNAAKVTFAMDKRLSVEAILHINTPPVHDMSNMKRASVFVWRRTLRTAQPIED